MISDIGENRLIRRPLIGDPMDGDGICFDIAFGIDIEMQGFACRHVVDHLKGTDFDDAMAFFGLEPVVSVSRTISRMLLLTSELVDQAPDIPAAGCFPKEVGIT